MGPRFQRASPVLTSGPLTGRRKKRGGGSRGGVRAKRRRRRRRRGEGERRTTIQLRTRAPLGSTAFGRRSYPGGMEEGP